MKTNNKNIKAGIISALEVAWPENLGPFVVELLDENEGKSWVIYQGKEKDCIALADEINKGLKFLGEN